MSEFDDWDEVGGPELRPVPRTRAKTTLIAVAVILGGVLLVAAGAWAIVRGAGAGSGKTRASGAAPSVTESFTTTAAPSGEQSSAAATPGASTTAPAPVSPSVRWTRAARVAYRLDGALWVSDEAGAHARRVIASAAGAFSLSPDGATLAVVGGSPSTLALVDVASSRAASVGPADLEAPVWSPSSAWLAYDAGLGTEVRRVDRDGRNARTLGSGSDPAIGPDGTSYAFVTLVGRLAYSRAGAVPREFQPPRSAEEVALSTDRIFYSVGATLPAGLSIRVMGLDGTGDRQLVGAPSDPKAGRYDDFMLDGDATWLVYTIAGDDMHSRMYAVRTDGGRDVVLSPRRDGYPLRWSADYLKILFIDGNVLQGESTQLVSVAPDGTSRLILVPNAGL